MSFSNPLTRVSTGTPTTRIHSTRRKGRFIIYAVCQDVAACENKWTYSVVKSVTSNACHPRGYEKASMGLHTSVAIRRNRDDVFRPKVNRMHCLIVHHPCPLLNDMLHVRPSGQRATIRGITVRRGHEVEVADAKCEQRMTQDKLVHKENATSGMERWDCLIIQPRSMWFMPRCAVRNRSVRIRSLRYEQWILHDGQALTLKGKTGTTPLRDVTNSDRNTGSTPPSWNHHEVMV